MWADMADVASYSVNISTERSVTSFFQAVKPREVVQFFFWQTKVDIAGR